ncbi:hypothetical protein LX87_03751 [Larkinella arboricola]|uniref:Uncharacterized protein n=1 Tax=Larkinella arboricola TaxID=643671 RepID=A0A327WW84_LARAB|nr:DUF6624 domain-containing protein [Larkinella arboricola]RAJ96001.1 hypothetical protein LX87_03751 [Larkinella arboricola]
MKYSLLSILCAWPLLGLGQVNGSLKRELDSMYVLDQRYRAYFMEYPKNQKLADSLMAAFEIKENLSGKLWKLQNHVDSLNLIRVKEIIKTHGYPGSSLVGKPTNAAAWHIIQHSPEIAVYFPIIEKAGQAGELPMSLVAMMHDRLLTEQHKPQRYGTQATCYPLKADPTKQECFIWPIENPSAVNERRKKAGFMQTVEENAKRLGLEYNVLTMEEVTQRYRF